MKNTAYNSEDKLTEKAFLQSILISAVAIVLCIIALSSMSFAWFTTNTESNSNMLVAGSFDLNIVLEKVIRNSQIEEPSEETERIPITLTPSEHRSGVYECTLQPGEYLIKLLPTASTTVKGHCVITLGDNIRWNTEAIICNNIDSDFLLSEAFAFTVILTESTTVTLEPRLGIVVEPDVFLGDILYFCEDSE